MILTTNKTQVIFSLGIGDMDEQLEAIKNGDSVRYAFIEGLIQQIQGLQEEHEGKIRELRAKEMLANTYQDRFEAAQKHLDDLHKAVDCDQFVLVLIDGDVTLWKDDYIKDGLQGGERAARDLRAALFDYLKSKPYFKHDHTIAAKIYLKLSGLSKTYVDAKTISSVDTFLRFVQGFNNTFPTMSVIDAGNGKEGADMKIRGRFSIWRAPESDNTYSAS